MQVLAVQPSDGAVFAFRAACVLAGTATPLYWAYKAAQTSEKAEVKDRVLRLLVASGVLELTEKTLLTPTGITRWRYWPPAKLAVVLWLLLDGGKVRVVEDGGLARCVLISRGVRHKHSHGACKHPPYPQGADQVYDHVAQLLRPYERDVDTLASAAAPLLHHAGHSYLTPVKAAACGCVAVCLAGFRLARARQERHLHLRQTVDGQQLQLQHLPQQQHLPPGSKPLLHWQPPPTMHQLPWQQQQHPAGQQWQQLPPHPHHQHQQHYRPGSTSPPVFESVGGAAACGWSDHGWE